MPLLVVRQPLLELQVVWLQPSMSEYFHVLCQCRPLSALLYINLQSCLLSRFAGDIKKGQVLLLLSHRHSL